MQGEADKKMEKFMENTTSALTTATKAIEALMKTMGAKEPAKTPSNNNREKKSSQDRPQCPHCKRRHIVAFDKCWELEANAASRPSNWKSVKDT